MELKIMSFNIKRDFGFEQKKHRWHHRKDLVAAIIKDSDCHIVGLQEVLPLMRDDLRNRLPHFHMLGFGRYHNIKPHQDEHTNILVNNKHFKVIENHTFWLSKRPQVAASRYLSAAFPRICTLVTIEYEGVHIRVLNTHLDHLSPWARKSSISLILDIIDELNEVKELPTILMGDFNTTQNSKVIRLLRKRMQDVFLQEEVFVTNTFHNYSGKQNPKKSPIDFIFVSHHFNIKQTIIINEHVNGIYPSDHFPIITHLKLQT